MTPVTVVLDRAELAAAVVLARARIKASGGMNHEKYKAKGLSQLAYDCCSAYGEFGVAKYTGLPYPTVATGVNTFHAPDLGLRTQVRTIGITEPGGVPPSVKKLIVRPNDDPSHLFVMAEAEMNGDSERRTITIWGWMEGVDAMNARWWRDDAWFVPRTVLQEPSDLLREVDL